MKIKSVLIKNFKTFDSEGIRLTMKDLATLGKYIGVRLQNFTFFKYI